MEMQISIRGLEELRRNMERLPGLLAESLFGKGMLAVAQAVARDARATAPYKDRTGASRRSIRARPRSGYVSTSRGRVKLARSAAQVLAGGKGARQAFILEFGRKPGPGYPGAPPFPYLEPAILSILSQVSQIAGLEMAIEFAKLASELSSKKPSRRTVNLLSA